MVEVMRSMYGIGSLGRQSLRIRQARRVDIDWIRRPSSPDAGDGTLNLCFNALDRQVVRGLADEVALRVDRYTAGRTELSFARLLEEVGAFGGVLRAFGVGPGERVLSRLPMGAEGLVAALATTRLGGVHVISDPYADPVAALATHRPAVALAEGSDSRLVDALAAATEHPRATIWRGDPPDGQDLEWDVLMRAGRTDPAPTAEVPASAEAFVLGNRTVTVAQALDDDDSAWPLDAIGTLLGGGTVLLSMP
jgi:acyl-CoA synthetase (AMP-forming)/AMP-acid ligase II